MNKRVSLAEMMAARELRVAQQKELIERFQLPLICFSLNIPGEIKDFPLGRMGFITGLTQLKQALQQATLPIIYETWEHAKTGSTGFLCIEGDPFEIKRICNNTETSSPLGRLYDIDVLGKNGQKISRKDLGQPMRRCLLCDNEAFACARSRTHRPEVLFAKICEILRDHLDFLPYCTDMAKLLQKSMLYELAATSKPGLVDRRNAGAHDDMDYFTFLDSAVSLFDYFEKIAYAALRYQGTNYPAIFQSLREIGITAEQKMFVTTNGVNTHKGAIFSLGIVAAAASQLLISGDQFSAARISLLVEKLTAGLIQQDLGDITEISAATNGEILYAKHGVAGIRGEAAQGFPTVTSYGLPAYREAVASGMNQNDAMLYALLHIMRQLDDSNILWRHDFYTLETVKQKANRLLENCGMNGDVMQTQLLELDREFIEQRISPGGAADLLAVTLAFAFLEELN